MKRDPDEVYDNWKDNHWEDAEVNDSEVTKRDVFYFGCWGEGGHYIWDAYGRRQSVRGKAGPWEIWELDTKLAPEAPYQVEFHTKLHHKEGWSAIAYWDRTVDHRPGSNSVFVAKGEHDFASMVKLFNEFFPNICKRIRPALTETASRSEQCEPRTSGTAQS